VRRWNSAGTLGVSGIDVAGAGPGSHPGLSFPAQNPLRVFCGVRLAGHQAEVHHIFPAELISNPRETHIEPWHYRTLPVRAEITSGLQTPARDPRKLLGALASAVNGSRMTISGTIGER